MNNNLPIMPSTSVSVTSNAVANETKALMQPWEDILKDIGDVKGFSLHEVWSKCLKVHDDNALLRGNVLQMETMLMSESKQWAQMRGVIDGKIEELDAEDEDFVQNAEALLDLNAKLIAQVTKLNRTIKDVRREVRAAEFQSKFLFHVNTVEMFMAALTGILMQALQSEEKRDYIMGQIRELSKMFGSLDAQTLVAQELGE